MHVLVNTLYKPSLRVGPLTFSLHSRSLSLAYTLHKYSDQGSTKKTHNVIVLHGLFGSKANNKTISQ